MCFILSECFKATTSGFSHQQLVSEPRSSENRSVFGIYPNFQSCQKHILIIPRCRVHPYKLTGARISFIGVRGSPHAPPEDSATVDHAHPTRPEVDDDWSPRAPYQAKPSRLSRLQSRAVSCAASRAEEYSPEYSRFNPSESPDVQNQFSDRFSPFLTHFYPSQTDSLLFLAFWIHLRCPFFKIQLPEGDIVIQRVK